MEKLKEILLDNNEILTRINSLILSNDRYLEKEKTEQFANEMKISITEAVFFQIISLIDLNFSDNKDRKLAEIYLKNSIHIYNTDEFKDNVYLKNIAFPKGNEGNWRFISQKYLQFELFYSDDLLLLENGRQIPQLGFFTNEVVYPCVYENDLLWMSVEPSEVNSMSSKINLAQGKVLVCGLGLGYYAYHVSRREDVSEVIIVEKEESVIHFFKKMILPQFTHKQKITIIHDDAFHVIKQNGKYDTIFVDLWHNAQDGKELYLRMKGYEKYQPQAQFIYWLENSLQSKILWENTFHHSK